MPEESKRKIKEDAEAIFRAVDGFGLSRVDFFLEESGRVVFNGKPDHVCQQPFS